MKADSRLAMGEFYQDLPKNGSNFAAMPGCGRPCASHQGLIRPGRADGAGPQIHEPVFPVPHGRRFTLCYVLRPGVLMPLGLIARLRRYRRPAVTIAAGLIAMQAFL